MTAIFTGAWMRILILAERKRAGHGAAVPLMVGTSGEPRAGPTTVRTRLQSLRHEGATPSRSSQGYPRRLAGPRCDSPTLTRRRLRLWSLLATVRSHRPPLTPPFVHTRLCLELLCREDNGIRCEPLCSAHPPTHLPWNQANQGCSVLSASRPSNLFPRRCS